MLVRPSYVLGGRGMEIVYDDATLEAYVRRATDASPGHPVLIDRFLDDAIEIDVDALYDGEELYLGGVMEHIEEAGIHSGDSACALPPITLGREYIAEIRRSTEAIARGVGVRGLLNVQYALAGGVLYVLEANPRASRTVPFVSKATAVPLAKAAARIMLGATVAGLRGEGLLPASGDGGTLPLDAPIAVKEAVLPFGRFRNAAGEGVDTVLGPEMRSTGEVMGIDEVFGTAFAKSQAAAYGSLPVKGRAFVSVANKDKRSMVFPVKRLADLGFQIWATAGTGEVLRRNGVRATIVRKHGDGPGPDGEPTIVERILAGQVDLIVNTPFGSPGQSGPRLDGYEIRTAAVRRGIPCITTRPAWRRPCRASRRSTPARWACGHCRSTRRTSAVRRAGRDGRLSARADGGGYGGSPPGRHRAVMTHGDGEAEAGPVQVRGTVLTVRRVDAYYAMTVVAPGIAARFRPGQFVTLAVGGPDTSMLLRRVVLDPRRPARSRRHRGVRVLRGRTRDPVAGRAPLPGRRRHHRAARPAVPGPAGPGQLPAGGRRLRQRAAVLAGRTAARAPVHGRLPARRGDRGPGLRRADRAAHRAHGHHHHRGRLAGRARHRHRHDGPDHPRGQDRRHLRLRADADAAPGDARWPGGTTYRCRWRWRS